MGDGGVKQVAEKGGFAGTARTADHRKAAEGNADIEVFEVSEGRTGEGKEGGVAFGRELACKRSLGGAGGVGIASKLAPTSTHSAVFAAQRVSDTAREILPCK